MVSFHYIVTCTESLCVFSTIQWKSQDQNIDMILYQIFFCWRYKIPRNCKNSANEFCYICDEFTIKSQRNVITTLVTSAYQHYFGFLVDERNKNWLPKICCSGCSRTLRGWLKGSHRSMPFSTPMIWSKPQNHGKDCYFCMIWQKDLRKNKKQYQISDHSVCTKTSLWKKWCFTFNAYQQCRNGGWWKCSSST